MVRSPLSLAVVASTLLASAAGAGVSVPVNYTVASGGSNNNPLNGLSAAATFQAAGSNLFISVQNTSTGVPIGFDGAASLLVSLGFNLPDGVNITTGNSALIGAGSAGLNGWSTRIAGASVGDEWVWTNDFGGDLMNSGQLNAVRQVLSTSSGQGGGTATRFDGLADSIGGPSGGIAASPATVATPLLAVQNTIDFSLTLSRALTNAELNEVADGSLVEFGSDVQYLRVPSPGSMALLGLAGIFALGRRR